MRNQLAQKDEEKLEILKYFSLMEKQNTELKEQNTELERMMKFY